MQKLEIFITKHLSNTGHNNNVLNIASKREFVNSTLHKILLIYIMKSNYHKNVGMHSQTLPYPNSNQSIVIFKQ